MKQILNLRMASAIFGLALLAGLGACASGGSADGNRYVITSEQIMEQPNMTAYQLARRLKPFWFQTRGLDNMSGAQELLVVVDGSMRGGVEVLQTYQTHDLEEIRYLNRRDATIRFGDRGGGGAILLTTRGG